MELKDKIPMYGDFCRFWNGSEEPHPHDARFGFFDHTVIGVWWDTTGGKWKHCRLATMQDVMPEIRGRRDSYEANRGEEV